MGLQEKLDKLDEFSASQIKKLGKTIRNHKELWILGAGVVALTADGVSTYLGSGGDPSYEAVSRAKGVFESIGMLPGMLYFGMRELALISGGVLLGNFISKISDTKFQKIGAGLLKYALPSYWTLMHTAGALSWHLDSLAKSGFANLYN